MPFSFYTILVRFLAAIMRGLRRDAEFRALLILMSVLLFGSTLFFHEVENWSYVDSLYFSVMTMSTVGYGDFAPSTDLAKIFTIFYSLMSIGVFVATAGKLIKFSIRTKPVKPE